MPIESTQDNTFEVDESNEILADNPKTFTHLDKDMDESGDTFEIMYDYTFNNESDFEGVIIGKSNFIINGNDHTLDGNGESRIFTIMGNNVTINNLVFVNGNITRGGAIYAAGQLTLNNVTFINNNAVIGGAIYSKGQMALDNAIFINNNASNGGAIAQYGMMLNCKN